jgi:hypothetical protein
MTGGRKMIKKSSKGEEIQPFTAFQAVPVRKKL